MRVSGASGAAQGKPLEEAREIEVKLELVGATEVAALRKALGAPVARHQQTNLYFDTTDEAWRAAGWSVRVRREDGNVELTLKGNRREAGAFRDHDEHTAKLAPALWSGLRACATSVDAFLRALAADRRVLLPATLDPKRLIALGAADTTREVFGVPGLAGAKLELDATTYPGGRICYEAEVEVKGHHDRDAALRKLEVLFAEAGVPLRVSKVTKQSRFREIWRASRAA